MAERWRRDLGLLDRMGPSPDLLDRARQGPRAPMPGPRRSGRVLRAALAFLIAAGGGVGAFAALHARGPAPMSVPAETGQASFLGLWPEDQLANAQQIQQQADQGDPAVQWRLDPEATASRFAAEGLGWTDGFVSSTATAGPGTLVVDVATTPPPCPAPGCPPWLLSRHVEIDLGQLITTGPTGIWSVTRVEGTPFIASYQPSGSNESDEVVGHLDVPLQPGQDVIAFSAGRASLSADCTTTGGEPSPGAPGELDRPLDGYVFVVVVHGSNPEEPWVPFGGPPPSDVTLVSLAVVPVHFVPAS